MPIRCLHKLCFWIKVKENIELIFPSLYVGVFVIQFNGFRLITLLDYPFHYCILLQQFEAIEAAWCINRSVK